MEKKRQEIEVKEQSKKYDGYGDYEKRRMNLERLFDHIRESREKMALKPKKKSKKLIKKKRPSPPRQQ